MKPDLWINGKQVDLANLTSLQIRRLPCCGLSHIQIERRIAINEHAMMAFEHFNTDEFSFSVREEKGAA